MQRHDESSETGQATGPSTGTQRVEEMLREIAFVLAMSRRVRDEIDAQQESEECAFA